MSKKCEIDPGEGYVLTTVFESHMEFLDNCGWYSTYCTSQEDMNFQMSMGSVYRRKMTPEELKVKEAQKYLGTAYDGSPMNLDWFINSLSPLCKLDENSSGIGNIVALQSFVINLIAKKKEQQ